MTASEVRNEVPCPMCAELILAVAKKCKHCGEMISGGAVETQRSSATVSGAIESTQSAPQRGTLVVHRDRPNDCRLHWAGAQSISCVVSHAGKVVAEFRLQNGEERSVPQLAHGEYQVFVKSFLWSYQGSVSHENEKTVLSCGFSATDFRFAQLPVARRQVRNAMSSTSTAPVLTCANCSYPSETATGVCLRCGESLKNAQPIGAPALEDTAPDIGERLPILVLGMIVFHVVAWGIVVSLGQKDWSFNPWLFWYGCAFVTALAADLMEGKTPRVGAAFFVAFFSWLSAMVLMNFVPDYAFGCGDPLVAQMSCTSATTVHYLAGCVFAFFASLFFANLSVQMARQRETRTS